jgi:hypothetical protein
LIDGQPTVELDYRCLHPAILYNREGLPLPGDAYAVYADQSETLRRGVKTAFNALLNSRNEAAALRACNLALSGYDQTGRMKPWDEVLESRELKWELADRSLRFKDIVQAVKKQHEAIRQYFGTGFGIHLQNEDVELVYHVCRHFCERAIPILPVHDSFIIEAQYEGELRDVMRDAYREKYRFKPVIH